MSVQPNAADSQRSIVPVRTLIERAEQAAARGEWEHARERFAAAIAADPTPASLTAFGIILAHRGQHEEAIPLLERAWNQACRLASPRLRAICCENLVIIHRRVGNKTLARQFGQLALAAQMESREFVRSATFSSLPLYRAAVQCSDEDDQVAALQQLHAARSVAHADREVAGASIESAIAVVMARCGMLECAVRRLFRSARLHLQLGNWEERAHDLSNLGHLLQALGRLRDAVWCFRLAARSFELSGETSRALTACQFEREARRRLAVQSCHPEHN